MKAYYSIRKIGRSVSACFAASALTVGLALVPQAALAIDVPANCQIDIDGANDHSSKTDITQFCAASGDATPYELNTIIDFDEDTFSTGADACVLFDTNGDAFVDIAVCVTIDGDAPGFVPFLDSLRLFTCNNTKADRCAGNTLVAGPYSTTCEVSQEDTDPFPGPAPGPGDDYPADTQILCGIDLDDFSGATDAVLRNACSYASSNPNANPSDCISFQTCTSDDECNDDNPCTEDTCDTTGVPSVCNFAPLEGQPCTDDQFCNGEEVCSDQGLCDIGSGTPVDCDDEVSCTLDGCDELGDVCSNEPMNSLCADGDFCNGVETCDALEDCQAGTAPDCGDFNPCTNDTCDEANDECDHTPSDAACDNGDFCDGSETCDVDFGCQPGTAPDCDDDIECTTDGCDEGEDECTHTADDSVCDDDLFCTGEESCVVGLGCAVGTVVDCNDEVECTIDECNEAADGCINTPDNTACDDDLYCNGAETCGSTGCEEGIPVSCSDGISCTADSCDEADDECDNVPNDAVCDDGNFCDGTDFCDAVLDCQDGTAPDCDDEVGCTLDSCNEDTDECDNTPNDASCSDGADCNGTETCDATEDCQDGTPLNCDDGIPCTVDSCDETFDECENVPDNAACSDGLFCNGAELCGSTGCEAGEPPNCGDGVGCTDDSCDEDNDECVNDADDANCDDATFCNGAETCDAELDCQPGTPPVCNDDVPCTVDTCDGTTDACLYTPNDASCSDGTYCNGAETCDAEDGCQPGDAIICNDGIPCTDDSCDEDVDGCAYDPVNAACSDGNFCTGVEVCDPEEGCQPGANPCPDIQCDEDDDLCFGCTTDDQCDNGVFCDGAETCDEGECVAGTVITCDDSISCTIDSCDEIDDECDNVASNAACDDGNYCNGTETCGSTGCDPGVAVDCGDAFDCTLDACNEATDQCDHTANDANCDDDTFCNGTEYCDVEEGCLTIPPPTCDDGIPCTTDSCDNQTEGCLHDPVNASCDDGVFCDGAEICDPEDGCIEGTPPTCNDDVDCTEDDCDTNLDECTNTASDAACDDDLYCNGVETCDPEEDCQAGTAIVCADAVPCTNDSCNETTDQCDYTADDSLCDNGDFCDGAETCDEEAGCTDPAPVDCDDQVLCTTDSCNEATDECDNVPDDAVCSDNVYCNGAEVCDLAAGCTAAAEPVDCDDEIECTSDSCDEADDLCLHTPMDGLCDDATFCNGEEVCTVGVGCEDTADIDCDDQIECTADACDEGMDTCTHSPDSSVCDDGLFCNGAESCNVMVEGGCAAGTPVNCADAFQCTMDGCDEGTDTCLHSDVSCTCGDMEQYGDEECDPPATAGTFEDCDDMLDNDADGRIDCRDPDCKPGAREPVCDESCAMDQVCLQFIRDPAVVRFGKDGEPDELYIHGRIPMRGDKLRASVHGVTFQLSNVNEPIYRVGLEVGDMRTGAAGRRFRFVDRDARVLGALSSRSGLEKVSVRTRRFQGVRYLVFTIRAFGDFSRAKHRLMTTELSVGPERGYLTQEWKATPYGWVLHQKNFDDSIATLTPIGEEAGN